jgi:hypothetical protein
MKLFGIISVGFVVISTTDLIVCRCQILRKKWLYNGTGHELIKYFKTEYDSVRRDVLYNNFLELGVPMKLDRQIKMCLNETYSKIRLCKYLSDNLPNQNDPKQGDSLSPLLFNFVLGYAIRKVQENQGELKSNWAH